MRCAIAVTEGDALWCYGLHSVEAVCDYDDDDHDDCDDDDADDVDDEGNWSSAESYYFTVYSNDFDGLPIQKLYNLARELFGNIIGNSNWVDIEFKKYEN